MPPTNQQICRAMSKAIEIAPVGMAKDKFMNLVLMLLCYEKKV
jgi:hypothetical protein|tara:strand:- start:441 stop:569 length:129 start_codon:yes stop_codon:yes gene_type:complete